MTINNDTFDYIFLKNIDLIIKCQVVNINEKVRKGNHQD